MCVSVWNPVGHGWWGSRRFFCLLYLYFPAQIRRKKNSQCIDVCYFLRIHPLCKPVVFKWVSWTSNISITWELVQGVNSGSTLNTLSSVFWLFQTLYFPSILPCIFSSPSHPLPSCCDQWDLRGRFIILLALCLGEDVSDALGEVLWE